MHTSVRAARTRHFRTSHWPPRLRRAQRIARHVVRWQQRADVDTTVRFCGAAIVQIRPC